MQVRSDVELANLTDIGCERTENEDYYCYFEPETDEDFESKGRLLAIADGMGGHAGGKVASGLAIEALRETFLNGQAANSQAVLIEAFARAQQAILAAGEGNPELNGMGTTCTAAILCGHKLTYGHIGDSRLYLVHDGIIRQLTEDHSLVNQLVKSGTLTPEQAALHEERNVLTAALGMKSQQVSADFSPEPLNIEANDVLVLTSDGMHGLVTAEEIAQSAFFESPYDACRNLVQLAKQRGGPDNITIQVLKVLPDPRAKTRIQ
jgi:serine/threonine protein phosphatase PrpC